MIYLEHMVPEIRSVASVLIQNTAGDPKWELKLREEIAYWVPEVSFLTSDSDEADIAFLIINGRAEYRLSKLLCREVRKLLDRAPMVAVYNMDSRRIYRVPKKGYRKWRFQQRVANFMWRAVFRGLAARAS